MMKYVMIIFSKFCAESKIDLYFAKLST